MRSLKSLLKLTVGPLAILAALLFAPIASAVHALDDLRPATPAEADFMRDALEEAMPSYTAVVSNARLSPSWESGAADAAMTPRDPYSGKSPMKITALFQITAGGARLAWKVPAPATCEDSQAAGAWDVSMEYVAIFPANFCSGGRSPFLRSRQIGEIKHLRDRFDSGISRYNKHVDDCNDKSGSKLRRCGMRLVNRYIRPNDYRFFNRADVLSDAISWASCREDLVAVTENLETFLEKVISSIKLVSKGDYVRSYIAADDAKHALHKVRNRSKDSYFDCRRTDMPQL